jgi:hypothetical protein
MGNSELHDPLLRKTELNALIVDDSTASSDSSFNAANANCGEFCDVHNHHLPVSR